MVANRWRDGQRTRQGIGRQHLVIAQVVEKISQENGGGSEVKRLNTFSPSPTISSITQRMSGNAVRTALITFLRASRPAAGHEDSGFAGSCFAEASGRLGSRAAV